MTMYKCRTTGDFRPLGKKAEGNMIQRLIQLNQEQLTPEQALALGLILLHGGSAIDEEIEAEYANWLRVYGDPTWENLGEWAAGLDIEAGLAEAIVKHTAREAIDAAQAS